MEKRDLLSAAIYNNRPFIEEWLKGEENVDVRFLGELLRKSAQYGSASVVELLAIHGMLELINVTLIFSRAQGYLNKFIYCMEPYKQVHMYALFYW